MMQEEPGVTGRGQRHFRKLTEKNEFDFKLNQGFFAFFLPEAKKDEFFSVLIFKQKNFKRSRVAHLFERSWKTHLKADLPLFNYLSSSGAQTVFLYGSKPSDGSIYTSFNFKRISVFCSVSSSSDRWALSNGDHLGLVI